MTSFASRRFWKAFHTLPHQIQDQAERAYTLWKENPYHESLDFKRIHSKRPIYSVRIGLHWRAVAVKEGDTITWFWIGSHSDYDRLIENL
ncbi:MAG TPA: hypothetical protein VGM92_03440 [Candidatus Kapabacteria bacterium]